MGCLQLFTFLCPSQLLSISSEAVSSEAVWSLVGSALVPNSLQLGATRRIEVAVWMAASPWLCYGTSHGGLAWPGIAVGSTLTGSEPLLIIVFSSPRRGPLRAEI